MAKTYNEIYINARRALKAAGVEAYGLEARLIVSQASGKTMEQLTRDLPLYATDELDRRVRELIERHLAGEPVAYITGSWEFYGIPLEITRDVLIPPDRHGDTGAGGHPAFCRAEHEAQDIGSLHRLRLYRLRPGGPYAGGKAGHGG